MGSFTWGLCPTITGRDVAETDVLPGRVTSKTLPVSFVFVFFFALSFMALLMLHAVSRVNNSSKLVRVQTCATYERPVTAINL